MTKNEIKHVYGLNSMLRGGLGLIHGVLKVKLGKPTLCFLAPSFGQMQDMHKQWGFNHFYASNVFKMKNCVG